MERALINSLTNYCFVCKWNYKTKFNIDKLI